MKLWTLLNWAICSQVVETLGSAHFAVLFHVIAGEILFQWAPFRNWMPSGGSSIETCKHPDWLRRGYPHSQEIAWVPASSPFGPLCFLIFSNGKSLACSDHLSVLLNQEATLRSFWLQSFLPYLNHTASFGFYQRPFQSVAIAFLQWPDLERICFDPSSMDSYWTYVTLRWA